MDQTTSSVLLLVMLPGIAVLGLILNLVLRARGGRSFVLHLKGFGIDLSVSTNGSCDDHCQNAKEIEDHVG